MRLLFRIYWAFVISGLMLMIAQSAFALGSKPPKPPPPPPPPPVTYQFGVQSLDGDPWRPVAGTTILVTDASHNLTAVADGVGIAMFTVPQGTYHVRITKPPQWQDYNADVVVNHNFNSGDPASPSSYFLAFMKSNHVDPMSYTEQQLRNFRGDFGGIYIPELIPQCPEDPATGVRCYEPARGMMAGEFFTAEYGVYTDDQRRIIREAYRNGIGVDGKPRNYTHLPLNVYCAPGRRDYHDIFPSVDCNKMNDLLHELWDSGIYPVCFILPDAQLTADLSHLDKSLCRIVVPMWEMNGPLNDDTAQINQAISWTREQFPDALMYVHFTAEHGAGGSPEGPWWQWAVRSGQDTWHNPPLPNPHVIGNLYQSGTWDDPQATIDRLVDYTARLGGGMNGWPGGTDIVMFETDIYVKFWDGRTEAQGVNYNDHLTKYMDTPLCEGSACGTLAGFCSGSSIHHPFDPPPTPPGPAPSDKTFGPGQLNLKAGQSVKIPGFSLDLQGGDGNFVVYTSGGQAVWAASPAGMPHCTTNNCSLSFQGDGNLVLYDGGNAYWATGTDSRGATSLIFQGHAPYLRILDGAGTVLWSSGA